MDVKAAPNGVATIEDRILRITGYYGYYPGYSSQKSEIAWLRRKQRHVIAQLFGPRFTGAILQSLLRRNAGVLLEGAMSLWTISPESQAPNN
ncbi:hypothetical protein Y1Q_0014768 [Alligator mississippiensis]|uniref:Uncharacterized protein n=1 Tax=Alligator mississippiensis TaxID=8496 RepID=A0A151M1V1_ALLMI|nr:hypothetical protein Y1Q_0014768 [Alligator mississippiensis]